MSAWKGKGRTVALTAAVLAGALAAPGGAQARGSVTVGIGIGPVFPVVRPYPYYYPPPPLIVYGPPPPVVMYRPPPPVAYAPPGAGMAADPAGPPYVTASGQLCREYRTTVIIEGRPQPAHGTACRMADGSWRVVN